ncbi:hypothetical protein [Geminocystis sp. GBBB08]|nr:hypothetical protein [Geminocystis sp. GBBB08]
MIIILETFDLLFMVDRISIIITRRARSNPQNDNIFDSKDY